MTHGTIQGPHGARGEVAYWRIGFTRWLWSVCLGGRTWTEPEPSRSQRVLRRAARRLAVTPNRETRRAVARLNRSSG